VLAYVQLLVNCHLLCMGSIVVLLRDLMIVSKGDGHGIGDWLLPLLRRVFLSIIMLIFLIIPPLLVKVLRIPL
jgi:hypothetical protein